MQVSCLPTGSSGFPTSFPLPCFSPLPSLWLCVSAHSLSLSAAAQAPGSSWHPHNLRHVGSHASGGHCPGVKARGRALGPNSWLSLQDQGRVRARDSKTSLRTSRRGLGWWWGSWSREVEQNGFGETPRPSVGKRSHCEALGVALENGCFMALGQ